MGVTGIGIMPACPLLLLVKRNAVHIVLSVDRNVLHDELCHLKRKACTLQYMAYTDKKENQFFPHI